jgi:hypothetical protein
MTPSDKDLYAQPHGALPPTPGNTGVDLSVLKGQLQSIERDLSRGLTLVSNLIVWIIRKENANAQTSEETSRAADTGQPTGHTGPLHPGDAI